MGGSPTPPLRDYRPFCVPPNSPLLKNGTDNQNICQLDGNISFDSSSMFSEPNCNCCDTLSVSDSDYDQDYEMETENAIPVLNARDYCLENNPAQYCPSPSWYDEYTPRVIDPIQSKANRITIKRDNRLLITEALPILSVSNLRSIWPRLNNFKTEVILRGISCALLSEVWEKANCSKQQFELEKMLNMDGLKYISTPRMTKRGGGAAIVANLKKFSLDKIEVSNPDKVEVVFGC